MDWRTVLAGLTPAQRAGIDLAAAFARYRAGGGADEATAFQAWLAQWYPSTAAAPAAPSPAPAEAPAAITPPADATLVAADVAASTIPHSIDAATEHTAQAVAAAEDAARTIAQPVAASLDDAERTIAQPVAASLDDAERTIAQPVAASLDDAERTIAQTPAATPPARSPASAGFDALAGAPVEVSIALPARFLRADPAQSTVLDPNRTVADPALQRDTNAGYATVLDVANEETVVSGRRDGGGEPAPAASDAAVGIAVEHDALGHAAHYRYVLTDVAGRGGMGTVHIAKDTELLRFVALKQLQESVSTIASARARFLREAQITAQLDHPNIVPVHALEVAPDGMPAYTMKLVSGKNFHALLDEARAAFDSGRRPDETVALAARIEHFLKACDAVAYAHDKGVIHRDLKPANLMLGRHNEVYVMDWGLCRALHQPDESPAGDTTMIAASPELSGGASDTQAGDIVGTPKYMSPEQAQGRTHELDTRSDQCALGLILFELATLSPPYEGKSAYEVLVNAGAGKRRPVVHSYLGKRGLSPDLVAIIDKATSTTRDHRYSSVAEFAQDLRRYQRGDAVRARPDSSWQRLQRAVGRHRQRVLTGILALVAVAATAIGWLLWQNQQVFESERLREQRLLQLRDAIADASSDVQVRLVQLESAIENLSDSVSQIADYGQPLDTPYFLLRDFKDPARAPKDLAASRMQSGLVSLSTPVWTLAPTTSEEAALPLIRKLASLQAFHRDIFHRSAVMIRNHLIDVYAQAAESGGGDDADDNPLTAITLGFSNGMSSRYPGWDGLPDDYDPRGRPWYTVAEGRHAPQWSDPYRNSVTQRTELSVSVPMYTRDQRFLGVAAAVLDPNRMVQSLLDIQGIAGIRDVVLIDANGHILASLNHTLDKKNTSDEKIETFPVPELLKRQKLHETGILETKLGGAPTVLSFDEVAPLGWYVVAVANPAQLLKQAAP